MKSRRIIVLFAASLLAIGCVGQWSETNVSPLNSELDHIFCGSFLNDYLTIQLDNRSLITDLPDGPKMSKLFSCVKGERIRDITVEDELVSGVNGNIGSAFFAPHDSTLWVCSSHNWAGQQGSSIKIYSFKWSKSGWLAPMAFSHNVKGFNTAHPYLSPEGDKLIFSSNRPGGAGGMDLWYCNWLVEGWSQPINLGNGVNSPSHEVFPVMWKNDIYYSSDRISEQGLDIYMSPKTDQWESCERLPEPFNSSEDDLLPIFIDDSRLFITSQRLNGRGGDDVYYFERTAKLRESGPATAMLECLGSPLVGARVTITNTLGEVVLRSNASDSGTFDISDLDLFETYRLKVEGIPVTVLQKSFMYFLNESGERVRVFELGSDGLFVFEYLPIDDLNDLIKMQNDDSSVLTIPVSGQIYESAPGDIGKGEPVFVTDEHGELLALTFTSDQGRFRFEELRPLANYVFQFSEDSHAAHMRLDSQEGDVLVNINRGVAHFKRLQAEEAIKLVDEHNRPIFIREDEVFIIRNIYYKFDSINLNAVAQSQLVQLSEIMKRNTQIEITLASHTDSRGEDAYNLRLSEKRAAGAMAFLMAQGVRQEAMVAIGYGESVLLNSCDDGDECGEKLHALNRRTEIAIHLKEEH